MKGKNNLYVYSHNNPIKFKDFYGLDDCIWGGVSGNIVLVVGVQVVFEKGRCEDDCGNSYWATRNCICTCVGLSAGGCIGGETGDDSAEMEGWSIGLGKLCVGSSGVGLGGGAKIGVAYCWCGCNVLK